MLQAIVPVLMCNHARRITVICNRVSSVDEAVGGQHGATAVQHHENSSDETTTAGDSQNFLTELAFPSKSPETAIGAVNWGRNCIIMTSVIFSRSVIRRAASSALGRRAAAGPSATVVGSQQPSWTYDSRPLHRPPRPAARAVSTSSSSSISLDALKSLRAQTGAPVQECKKALEATAADGSLDAALDWLRRQGAAAAARKLVGRDTPHGLVGLAAAADGRAAALVRVAAETDFAGRSGAFCGLVARAADAALAGLGPGGVLEARDPDSGKSVQELLNEAIVAIRENLSVAQAVRLATEQGIVVGYVHNRIDSFNAGTSGAVVELQVADASKNGVSLETLQAIGKKLAMHVVAARPQYLTPEDVPQDIVAKEKAILASQVEDTGKPPQVVEKIIEGRLRKFYEGVCLTEQGHMLEEKNPKVFDVLKRQGVVVKKFEAMFIA